MTRIAVTPRQARSAKLEVEVMRSAGLEPDPEVVRIAGLLDRPGVPKADPSTLTNESRTKGVSGGRAGFEVVGESRDSSATAGGQAHGVVRETEERELDSDADDAPSPIEVRRRPRGDSQAPQSDPQGLLFEDDLAPRSTSVGLRAIVACEVAGVTPRQLDHWTRLGLLAPASQRVGYSAETSRTVRRFYSLKDILMLKVIKRLIDAGISLEQVSTIVEAMRTRDAELTGLTLMSDGISVFEATSDDEIINLLRGGQGVFGIALGGVWRELEATVFELPESELLRMELVPELEAVSTREPTRTSSRPAAG